MELQNVAKYASGEARINPSKGVRFNGTYIKRQIRSGDRSVSIPRKGLGLMELAKDFLTVRIDFVSIPRKGLGLMEP